MKRTSLLIAAVLVAASAFALPRKAAEITVSGYTGKSALENFPVLVRISPECISGFSYADCAADGADVAFRDAQGNLLDRVGGTVTARGGTNPSTADNLRHYGTDGTAVWLAASPAGTILFLQ